MLTNALKTSQNDLDSAVAQLGIVESERLDGIAQIESSEQRLEELRDHIDKERKDVEEEISSRIASFHKFEKVYWSKQQEVHSQLGYLG